MAEARTSSIADAFPRERLVLAADWLVVAVAASLPWSTSATGILVALWLVALLPTLGIAAIGREVSTPAGGLPVALWAFAAAGMLWADASLAERLAGLASYHKLLAIPLLLAQFRRSDRALQAASVYLASVLALLAASWAMAIWPKLQEAVTPHTWPGVPVKDYITQSGEFLACAFVLLYLAGRAVREGRRMLAGACVALALALFANLAFVATGRTTLVVFPVLLVMLGARAAGWKGALALSVAGLVLASAAWVSSASLRDRVLTIGGELHRFQAGDFETPGGQRLAFWTRSIALIEQAPLVGHGTMRLKEIFQRSAVGSSGIAARVTANPHNQVLAVAVQLGAIGAGLLLAMWVAHLLLFTGGGRERIQFQRKPISLPLFSRGRIFDGEPASTSPEKALAAWIGLVIVVQNVVSSLLNSHLLDFTQGWTYVFGVGVMGGALLRQGRTGGIGAP